MKIALNEYERLMAQAADKLRRSQKVNAMLRFTCEQVARGLRIEAETGEDTPESQQLEGYAAKLEAAVKAGIYTDDGDREAEVQRLVEAARDVLSSNKGMLALSELAEALRPFEEPKP